MIIITKNDYKGTGMNSHFCRSKLNYKQVFCPNTEFFLSVFSPSAGKYGPEKTPYLDTFHAVKLSSLLRLPPLKMITSGDIVFEAQFKNFFILRRSRVPFLIFFIPFLSNPRRSENKSNFYFHTTLWCLKRFYEGLKGLKRPNLFRHHKKV